MSRKLWCLMENDDKPFRVTAPIDIVISELKELIREKVANVPYAKDLTLWKPRVPIPMEPPQSLAQHIANLGPNFSTFADKLYPIRLVTEVFQEQSSTRISPYLDVIVRLPDSAALPNIQKILQAARKLYDTLWGKDLNDILLDVPNGNGLQYVPRSRVDDLELDRLKYREEVLLVRKEYVVAFEQLETQSKEERSGGVVVVGQPGIGKSCFLFYVLFRRLCAMRPTALHTSNRFVVFKDAEVTVHDAAKEEEDALPPGTWALTDSNEFYKQPCPTFLSASAELRAWVVQATSPAMDRWYQWSKQSRAGIFVMNCFTYEELIALGTILDLDLDRFREQVELWGSTARTSVTLTRRPNQTDYFIGLAIKAAKKFAEKPDGFPDQIDNVSYTSHLLMTIRPKDSLRVSAVGDIETKFLRNLVDKAIQELDAKEQVDFFYKISKHPWLGAPAGYVFEKFVCAWFFSHPTSKGLLCTARSLGSPKPLHLIPVCENVHIFSGMTTFKDAGKLETPFCWLPASQSFPVTDAIICTNMHIITIQSTVSSRHETSADQFKRIQDNFPPSFRSARQWCHVFVTDNVNKAKALRDQVFKGLSNDIDIYSAVLSMDEFYLPAAEYVRLEKAKNEVDKDTPKGVERQVIGASGTMTGVSADGPGGEQQMDIDLGQN